MMTDTYFNDYLARKQRVHGSKFSAAGLAAQFVPYLHSDVRIKVELRGGEIKTGTVGVTTGWRPVFILMRRSSSHGSSIVLSNDDKIIAVKRGRQYVALKGGQ